MKNPSHPESSRVRRSPLIRRPVYDVPAARKALVLVRRIVAELMAAQAQASHQHRQLERQGAALRFSPTAPTTTRDDARAWTQRKQWLAMHDQCQATTALVTRCQEELLALGVALLDAVHGVVGFPTLVNGGLAYLVYDHEQQELAHWRYRDQNRLRPIPQNWGFDLDAVPLPQCQPAGMLT